MNRLSLIILILCIHSFKGEELKSSPLEALGISGAGELVNNDEIKTICSTESKLVMDPKEALKQIKDILGNCQNKRNEQMKKKAERIEKDGKKLKEVAEGLGKPKTDADGKKFRDKLKKPPSDKDEQVVKKFSENCKEEGCADLKQKFSNVEESKKCLSTISKLMYGVYCGLLGENASDYVTMDSTGTITSFKISEENSKTLFEDCYDYFILQCDMTNMYEVMQKSSGKERSKKRSKKGLKIQAVCEKITELETCKDDLTKCSSTLSNMLTEAFFSIGKNCAPGEPDEELDEGASEIEELNSDTTASEGRLLTQNPFRILAEATSDCEVVVSSTGFKALKVADSSDVDFSEFSNFISIVSTFVSLFAFVIIK